jgi:hypothetical protein
VSLVYTPGTLRGLSLLNIVYKTKYSGCKCKLNMVILYATLRKISIIRQVQIRRGDSSARASYCVSISETMNNRSVNAEVSFFSDEAW